MTASPPKQGKKLAVPSSKPATATATRRPPQRQPSPSVSYPRWESLFFPFPLSTTASQRHRNCRTIALRGRIHTDITFDCSGDLFAFFLFLLTPLLSRQSLTSVAIALPYSTPRTRHRDSSHPEPSVLLYFSNPAPIYSCGHRSPQNV